MNPTPSTNEITPDVCTPQTDHSVPCFWPFAAAIEMQERGLQLFERNLKFFNELSKIDSPPMPEWATPNRVQVELDTMYLRDFSPDRAQGIPVLIDAPYAGHTAIIADYDKGQSLVGTLQAAGLPRVLVTDWKNATPAMRNYDIDKYLADLNAAIDNLGGMVHLVGLCQGGWLSAMLAALYPEKVRTLILAGAPIDMLAGDGPIKKMAQRLPLKFYEDMVTAGGGLMLGRFMLAGWKNMHPDRQYLEKYIDLYQHIEDGGYLRRTERFERWYENAVNLPGRFYLQAIDELFKKNKLARGEFVGLGRPVDLKNITAPAYLMAGRDDDITTWEQVFAAEKLIGTPPELIVKQLVPGGHIGLFMGSNTLRDVWPGIAQWIRRDGKPAT